ncbi:MAG: TIM-barrel domain-containing protein, partial [Chloroflexota bacterium]
TDTRGRRASMWAASPALDWYVIDGPDPADVVARFTELVGAASLPPRWALGYHQARWSYETEAEVREIADGLRGNAIPADAVHLDIHHMDGYRAFTWDHQRFPDPAGLARSLATAGLRTTVVVDAPVAIDDGAGDSVYQEGRRLAAYVRTSDAPDAPEVVGHLWGGLSVYPDHLRPEIRDWWGSLYRRQLDLGMAGFANDMNEPAMHDRPMDDPGTRNVEPPRDAPFGPADERTTHAEARNVYGLLEDAATRAGLLAARPDERPFLITRSGFAGVQRYAIVWTGDDWSRWEHLAMSLPQLLNLGLSGVPIAGADIGGFFEDCSPELLVRWMQLGAFYPFARNNSAVGTGPQEPWAFGEPTTSRCRRAIELRYRLLPYLYTVVEEACRTGYPVLRPLLFHAPGDARAVGVEDEAFVGRDLLIAPILMQGAVERKVYLPSGSWYDIRTGEASSGGAELDASASLDEDVPVYARAGAIIPSGPLMQWSDERPVDPLTLDVYLDPDGTASGRLYEDDGVSMGYLDGETAETTFSATPTGDGSTLVSAERAGRFRPPPRAIVVRAHDGRHVSERRIQDADAWELTIPMR